jgi:hypothetical protein
MVRIRIFTLTSLPKNSAQSWQHRLQPVSHGKRETRAHQTFFSSLTRCSRAELKMRNKDRDNYEIRQLIFSYKVMYMFISTFWYLGGRFDKHNSLMPNFTFS